MIDIAKNNELNAQLFTLYETYTQPFLSEWIKAFGTNAPPRINEFGIINEECYDADNGILFIGKETNGWDDSDFASGILFRTWMQNISLHGLGSEGHVKRHPNMWYNKHRNGGKP